MTPSRARSLLVVTAVVVTLAGCTAGTEPSPAPATSAPATTTQPTAATTTSATSSSPVPSSDAPATTSPGAVPTSGAVTPNPGDPCDPADGDPDCTDATGYGDGVFRHIVGYADCVEQLGADEAYSLCVDLDDDGYAGYPDSH